MPGTNPYSQASSVQELLSGASPVPAVSSPSPGSASGSGVGPGLLSSLFSFGLNQLSAHISRRWQERMMAKQRQWQLDDWKRVTQYNSPSAVMARMSSAGLNPDLLVGGNNSSVNMPAVGSLPSGSDAHPADFGSLRDSLQARLAQRQVESEIELAKANAEAARAAADEHRANAGLLGEKTTTEFLSRRLAQEMHNSTLRLNDAQINNLAQITAKTFEDTKYQQIVNSHAVERLQAELDDLVASKELKKAERDQINRALFELQQTWEDRKKKLSADASNADTLAKQALEDWMMRTGVKPEDAYYLINVLEGITDEGKAEKTLRKLKLKAADLGRNLIKGAPKAPGFF